MDPVAVVLHDRLEASSNVDLLAVARDACEMIAAQSGGEIGQLAGVAIAALDRAAREPDRLAESAAHHAAEARRWRAMVVEVNARLAGTIGDLRRVWIPSKWDDANTNAAKRRAAARSVLDELERRLRD